MKMTKRIFIALLIVSIMVSAFAITASADEEPVVVDYNYVLEYFEEPTLFYNDYTGGELDPLTSLLVKRTNTLTAEYVEDENAPGGKYLSLAIASATNKLEVYTDNHVFLNWSSETAIDDFIINMTVSGDKGEGREQNLPRIIIAIGDEEYSDASVGFAGTTLAALDYRRGSFYYLKAETAPDGTVSGVETKTPFDLTEGAWYDVSVSYDVESGNATVTITDSFNPDNTYTVEDAYVPYNAVKNVRVGAYGEDYGTARGSVINLASVYALGGLYQRNPYNAQAEVEAILLEMYETFNLETTAMDDMIEICELVKKVITLGFTTENADVQTVLDDLGGGIVGFYNSKMQECIDTYMDLPTYLEKRELVDDCLGYIDQLNQMDLSDTDPELLAALEVNIEAIDRANNYLFGVSDNCYAFMDEVAKASGCNISDYVEASAYLNEIEMYPADPTYPGIEDSYKFYVKMRDSVNSIKASGDLFIELVGIANNAELDINVRADAYRELQDCYFDNETYPGMTEALAVYHNDVAPYISVVIDTAENFIKYASRADYAVYVSAKQENIDIANTYADCHSDYKGVAEARAILAEVQQFVDEQIKNAKAYISSVNALDVLVGDELLEAVEYAKSLKNKGNVLGVDGVTNANIKLDKIIASIELRDKYCIYFMNLVESIDSAASSEELYRILAEAKAAEADADPSYDGVCDASAKLAAAISDYNDLVSKINSDFVKANETAANTAGIGKTANTVADHVIALIKKFFDEE